MHWLDTINNISDAHHAGMIIADSLSKQGIGYDFLFDTGNTLNVDHVNNSSFTTAINSNAYELISPAIHGSQTFWYPPLAFYSEDASGLHNSRRGTVVTGSCYTAAFDYKRPCLAKAWLTNPSGGSICYIGSSREGWGSKPMNTYGQSEIFVRNIISKWSKSSNYLIGDVMLQEKQKETWNGEAANWLYFSNCMLGDSYSKSYCRSPMILSPDISYLNGIVSFKVNAPDRFTTYYLKNLDSDTPISHTVTDSSMIDPGQDKDFTISMINPNYLPYVMSVSIIKNETIDTTKEISSDLILIGPDVIISSSGNLTLKCKRIIQSPSIHIENGGTLKIEQYEDH